MKKIYLLLILLIILASCKQGDLISDEQYNELPTQVYNADYFDLPDGYSANSMIYKNDSVYILGRGSPSILLRYGLNGDLLDTRTLTTVMDRADVIDVAVFSDGSYVTQENYFDTEANELKSSLVKYSPDGEFITLNDNIKYQRKLYVADDDIVYHIDDTITLLTPDLEMVDTIRIEYFDNVHITGENKIVFRLRDRNTGEVSFRYIDTTTHTLSDKFKIDEGYSDIFYSGDDEYDYYLTNDIGLYGYKESGTVLLLNWTNSDLSSAVDELVIFNPDKVLCQVYNSFKFGYDVANLTRIPDDEVKPKTILNVAYINADLYKLIPLITEFNRVNSEYRIVLNDYGKYNEVGDDTTGLNLLNADIAADRIPDIFIIDQGMPADSYIKQGLFTDLYDHIDGDRLLNCVRLMETDSKLYQLIYSFNIQTLAGKHELVGNDKGWTVNEMIKIFNDSGAGYIMYQSNPLWILQDLLTIMYDELIDEENGVCHFDDDDFYDLVEFVTQITADTEKLKYSSNNNEYYDSFINGDVLLANYTISNLANFYSHRITYFNDINAVMKGYPSTTTNGSFVDYNYSIAVSSQSEKTEGIKAFLEFILDDYNATYDRAQMQTIPPTLSALHRMIEEEREWVYVLNGTGYSATKTDKEEFLKSMESSGGTALEFNDERVNEYIDFIQSVNYVRNYNTYKAYDIFIGELEIYFNGSKTLEETVDVIQNRMAIYVAE